MVKKEITFLLHSGTFLSVFHLMLLPTEESDHWWTKYILKGLLSEANGTPGLHIQLQQLLNLCYIKDFPLAADSI